MKQRFDCVDGKVQKVQRSTCQEQGQFQPEPSPAERAESDMTSRSINVRYPLRRRRSRNKHPESPWDERLRHPWVSAYRRVHGGGMAHRHN